MRKLKANALSLILGSVFFCGTTGIYAQLVGSTGETLVNTNTTDSTQQNCAISMDTLGRYVVVWESEGQDGDGFGIYAKIYNEDHTVRVSDFLINTSDITNDQRFPDVAMNAEGTFCVVWQSDEDEGDDGFGGWNTNGWDCYRQIFDIDGAAVSSRSRMNSSTAGNQMHPAVAAADDRFVVTWASEVAGENEFEIKERYFLSNGANLAAPTVIQSVIGQHLTHPDVAMSATGAYTFTWQADSSDGDRIGIYYAMYDNTYVQIVAPTQVNTTTAGNQQEPRVAMDENGEFMIVWSSFDQDGDHFGIYGQRFTSLGASSGGEIAINTTTANSQDHVAVAVTREGGKYIISWTDDVADGDYSGVYTRIMFSNGTFIGNDALVNTTTSDYQNFSDVAIGTDNTEAVYAWQSGINSGSTSQTDPSYYGIYAQGFVVEDITPPVAVCENVSVYLDGTGNVSIAPTDVDGGSSDNVGITSMTLSTSDYTCADLGNNSTTLTVFDAAGLSDVCVSAVTVLDTISPSAVCQDITVYLDGTGNAIWGAIDIDNGSTDNCSTITLTADMTSATCAEVGANTVTLTVTDGSGNISMCTSTVTVLDTISPSAVCQDITVYLDGTGNVTIVGADLDGGSTDNCAGGLSFSANITSFTCAEIGANTVTLTVTDPGGNASNCTSTVTVLDTISPTIICQDITVYLDGTGNATITSSDVDGGSTDNCGAPTLGIDVSAFTCAMAGTNTVTLTGTDASGNMSSCVATVTVADTTSPVAVCQSITVYLDGAGTASIVAADIDGGSSDNCSSVGLSADITSFTCAEAGANTVTLSVIDGSGNTSSCTSIVTVLDTITPTVVCQDITVYLDGTGNASINSGDVDGGSTDNCGAPIMSVDASAFTCAMIGANSVTLTATDGSGNTDGCTSIVTVLDTISPTIVCQDITVYLDGTGNATITSSDVDGGSSDNCGIPTLGIDVSAFTCAMTGANTVTLTATDASGNTNTCTSTVTVLDTISPTIVCQDITAYLDGTGNVSIVAADIDGGSTDNCGLALTADITSFTCANIGANSVELTVTDPSGNAGTCISTVTVLDTISPTVVCQDITVYLDGTGNATITAADVDGGSTDNCAIPILSIDVSTFDCSMTGANTVTLTGTDASGNNNSCISIVTVLDTISPTIICQDITVYLDGTGNATIAASDVDGGSTDNCGTPTLGIDVTAFTCGMTGANTVTLTATDATGNSSTCTSTVNVLDTIAPTAVCQDITVYLDAAGNASIVAADIDGGSSDNCTFTIAADITSFTCAEVGANSIALTVTDAVGNSSVCNSTVTVTDTISPTASNLTALNVECIGDAPTDIALVTDEADNCSVAPVVAFVGDVSDGLTCPETITRSYSVTDDSGNSINVTQTITVLDITPPTASNPLDLSVQCAAEIPTAVVGWVTDEADNCGTPVVAWVSDVSDGLSCPETITRTFSVTDICGNSINVTQMIIVLDIDAPVADITALTEVTSNCDVTPPVATATDNCSGAITGVPDAIFPITALGTTIVTWTYTDDCGNVSTQTQDVTITALDVTTTMASDNITIVAGNTTAGVTYQWIDCNTGQSISGETNHNYTPTYGSNFAVIITQNGCSDTSACVASTVGIDPINIELGLELMVFPNPSTNGHFSIELKGEWSGEVVVELVDLRGRLVYSNTTIDKLLKVELDDLQTGTYFINAKDEAGNVLTTRLVTVNN
ncbi:MAG: hypothetical protein ACJA1C_001575 [Crocinitomicaceae bacterium]|jgi:hypothetical protein